jgi:hypothetical protein
MIRSHPPAQKLSDPACEGIDVANPCERSTLMFGEVMSLIGVRPKTA